MACVPAGSSRQGAPDTSLTGVEDIADTSPVPDVQDVQEDPDNALDSPSDEDAMNTECVPLEPIAPGVFAFECAEFGLHVTSLASLGYRLEYRTPAHVERPSWALPVPATTDATASACVSEGVTVVSGAVGSVSVDLACRIVVRDGADEIVLEDGPAGGWVDGPTLRRSIIPGERFYGLGENTGPLERRGTRVTFWNTDAYDSDHGGYAPGADPLYLSVPFYIGVRGDRAYGVFTDNPHRMVADMGAADRAILSLEATGGTMDQFVLFGPQIADVVERYTSLTGRTPVPPRWALGYHQSRWGYSPDERLRELAREFRDRRIPADVLWLDIQHMDGFRSFSWDPRTFPDPGALATELESRGFRLVVIDDPGIKVDPGWPVYDSGAAADIFLRTTDGDPFVGEVWAGASSFPDFSNPAARAWWAAQVGAELARGVDGIWLDVNEPTTFPEGGGGYSVPDDVPVDGDGLATDMAELHNVYASLQAQATWEGMREAAPDRRPFIVSRAGYAGIQRHAAVWTGDVPSTWPALRETLPMLLNLGLSGVPFVGSDVGGYSGHATPELYARWIQLGLLSPFFRTHTTNGVNDQEPWAFGQEVEDISRAVIERRYRLAPYLYSLFAATAETGAPILRPMVYAFQDDPRAHAMQDQAMLGPWLLAAPVLEEAATQRTLYLPEGRWFEFDSGAVYEGPADITLDVTLAALPLFVRQGAILPSEPVVQHDGERTATTLHLDLYPGEDPSHFTLFEDDGDGFGPTARTRFTLQRTQDGASFIAGPVQGGFQLPDRRTRVRFRRVAGPVSQVVVNGNALARVPTDADLAAGRFWHDLSDQSLVVVLDMTADFEIAAHYTDAPEEQRAPVAVPITVYVPPGTPRDAPIHITSSANEWVHQPLVWVPDEDVAVGELLVPRGEWFYFKYTRGDWDTVEKWPGCQEAENRYGFGAAHPARNDVVFAWRDLCE